MQLAIWKNCTDEFKTRIAARDHVTNKVKKMEASKALSIMDEGNLNKNQTRITNRFVALIIMLFQNTNSVFRHVKDVLERNRHNGYEI